MLLGISMNAEYALSDYGLNGNGLLKFVLAASSSTTITTIPVPPLPPPPLPPPIPVTVDEAVYRLACTTNGGVWSMKVRTVSCTCNGTVTITRICDTVEAGKCCYPGVTTTNV